MRSRLRAISLIEYPILNEVPNPPRPRIQEFSASAAPVDRVRAVRQVSSLEFCEGSQAYSTDSGCRDSLGGNVFLLRARGENGGGMHRSSTLPNLPHAPRCPRRRIVLKTERSSSSQTSVARLCKPLYTHYTRVRDYAGPCDLRSVQKALMTLRTLPNSSVRASNHPTRTQVLSFLQKKYPGVHSNRRRRSGLS